MKLYKYRSLKNIDHVLDILLNEQLHCAPLKSLNDPFEGIYVSLSSGLPIVGAYSVGTFGVVEKKPKSISVLPELEGILICSLSSSPEDVRLWSHYANGHKGIVIEIELDKEEDHLFEVHYHEKLKELDDTISTSAEKTEILSHKTVHWKHEDEYRIITENEFHSIKGKISGVYLGLRTQKLLRKMLLRLIPNSIPVYSTKLNENTITVELSERLN